jgi:hypothetical protein
VNGNLESKFFMDEIISGGDGSEFQFTRFINEGHFIGSGVIWDEEDDRLKGGRVRTGNDIIEREFSKANNNTFVGADDSFAE